MPQITIIETCISVVLMYTSVSHHIRYHKNQLSYFSSLNEIYSPFQYFYCVTHISLKFIWNIQCQITWIHCSTEIQVIPIKRVNLTKLCCNHYPPLNSFKLCWTITTKTFFPSCQGSLTQSRLPLKVSLPCEPSNGINHVCLLIRSSKHGSISLWCRFLDITEPKELQL